MTEDSSVPTPRAAEPGPSVLRGTPVAPGFEMGPAHCKRYALEDLGPARVPRERVEHELNRFQEALTESRRQLEELRSRLRGKVPGDQAGILDTHVSYLKDSVFLSDVENLIVGEQMSLEAAIAKVVLDFDRIFRLVESESLRERAVDLRDVGIRVLRSLERDGPARELGPPEGDYLLVTRELSIVDMFNLEGERVLGVITEEGSLTSHAAVLARSLRIPTLTAVSGLLETVREGDFMILDATEGVLRLRPDELVRRQFLEAREERERAREENPEPPAWARAPVCTKDGESITVSATCGNLPEVERAVELGATGVGLYRTELLFLIDREPPSLDALTAHYHAVLSQMGERGVTFRLLDLDSGLEIPYLHEGREPNPALGRVGVRALLAHEGILRRQLQAILRAGADAPGRVRIAVPKVVDCGELRRVREVLFEERIAYKKAGTPYCQTLEVGVVLETPAAALAAENLAGESDFLLIGLDSLQQYLLAADRDNGDLAAYFHRIHPAVVRLVGDIQSAADERGTPLSIFGVTATAPENLPFLLGVGLRQFCVAPIATRAFLEALRALEMRDAIRAAELAARVSTPAELDPVLQGYGRGLGGG